MHQKKIIQAGKKLNEADKVLIMLHGRGGNALDILSLAEELSVENYALLAPEASNNTWYPYSFLTTPSRNEPWLSSALNVVNEITAEAAATVTRENIYFLGFSQGAWLLLEFITRNTSMYGGAIAFTGGLIGDKIYTENYKGNFANTPVFIGTSNPDPHIPVKRVNDTTEILRSMHADVTEKIYDNMGHTINRDEISEANSILV